MTSEMPQPIIPGVEWERTKNGLWYVHKTGNGRAMFWLEIIKQPRDLYSARVSDYADHPFYDSLHSSIHEARDALARWLEQLVDSLTGGELRELRKERDTAVGLLRMLDRAEARHPDVAEFLDGLGSEPLAHRGINE